MLKRGILRGIARGIVSGVAPAIASNATLVGAAPWLAQAQRRGSVSLSYRNRFSTLVTVSRWSHWPRS